MSTLGVLHVNTESRWRGGEGQTLMLARGLAARGHRCLVAAREGSALSERSTRAGLDTWILPRRSGEFGIGTILALARAIRGFRPDVVHYHTSHAITLGSLASLLSRRAAAVATRRVSFPLRRNPLARLKYTARVDHLIAVADEVRWVMTGQGIPPDMVSVVHSGIDLERFRPRGRDPGLRASWGYGDEHLVVGSVGHLAAHKGQEHLVDAAARVLEARPETRFVLVGEGERREALEARVRELGLEDRFRFVGFVDDVAPLFRAFDLFALPSVSGEGSPAVVKEAMACGVPVVSSRLEGVREIARDEREVLLVPAGQPEPLAAALIRLVEDEPLRDGIRERALERVKEFSVERTVDRTLEVYARILARTRRRRR